MFKSKERNTGADYMYKFRTKHCTKKICRNPSKCFDAHSEVMRRRVPTQGEHGLWNYIPEPCPQWQKLKKCSLGKSCPRSHGWLEVIFHPLLYRTKMCKSDVKNGVCRQYGVYCAKAHKPTDIRNLVKIYGKDWKKHYECSDRAEARGSTTTSPSLTNSSTVIDPESPMLCASPPIFGDDISICDRISDFSLDGGVTSYIQLYSEKVTMVETDVIDLKNYKSPIANPWDCTVRSPGTDGPPMEFSPMSSCNSNFMSRVGENWKSSSDVYGKIDVEELECDMENRPTSKYGDNPDSLFAQPLYESNWYKLVKN